MRALVRLRPLAALLLVGCASAAYARAGGEAGGEASITAEPVSLAVRVVEPRAVFSSEQTIFLENGGDGHAMRFTGSSRIEVRPDAPRPAHAFWLRRYEAPLSLRLDGEDAPLRGDLVGLEDIGVRMVVDGQRRVVEGPDLMDRPGAGRLLRAAVLALTRIAHLTLPDAEVQVGARWRPAPYVVDLLPGRVDGVRVTPELELVGVERSASGPAMARIEWHSQLRVPPFAAMGTRVEGRGEIRGFTLLSLEDGVSARSELDFTVAFGPAGGADLLPVLTVTAKYAERVSRRPGRQPRPLLSPVSPVDPRE